ncbi:hypothetical protein Pyn_10902 [Prunus yedoensis var. nudiflora]|uniref:Uncharacterized protein n=1 Tax=Prunus yedoensis var. nudiflora TaxID=2094558 RepID=A0A314UAR5_PRUYE|nr:hypothetical protein Pyn_10902 [Prunus yedoensis var. nudiflora]
MARSDEGKEVDIHAGSKGASGGSQASTPWFLECSLLGTCSSMCWNLQQLCSISLQTSLFVAFVLPASWGNCMGQDGLLSKWAFWLSQ